MTDNKLSDLCKEMQDKAQLWLDACSASLNVRIIITWRSADDQNKAEACGLSKAIAGASPHNCTDPDGTPASKAFDFAIFDDNGNYITDGKDERYSKAGEIGKDLGLVWGGDFRDFPDPDHLQLPFWRKDNLTTNKETNND